MFEDIIGSRPKFNLTAELEKNGEMADYRAILLFVIT